MVKLEKLITLDTILIDMHSTCKRDAIGEMCALLQQNGKVTDSNAFLADIMQKEKIETTNLNIGIAIPHSKSASVREVSVAIGRLGQSISWEDDDEEVDALMLIAIPEHDNEVQQLNIIASLATMLKEITFISDLYNATSKEDIFDSISSHLEQI